MKVLKACAILHNCVLNNDKILLDDEGDEDIKDGPVHMGYYPMRLDPNVEEDKIIIDRLHPIVDILIKLVAFAPSFLLLSGCEYYCSS